MSKNKKNNDKIKLEKKFFIGINIIGLFLFAVFIYMMKQ